MLDTRRIVNVCDNPRRTKSRGGLNVAQIKQKLMEMGVSTAGTRAELVRRLCSKPAHLARERSMRRLFGETSPSAFVISWQMHEDDVGKHVIERTMPTIVHSPSKLVLYPWSHKPVSAGDFNAIYKYSVFEGDRRVGYVGLKSLPAHNVREQIALVSRLQRVRCSQVRSVYAGSFDHPLYAGANTQQHYVLMEWLDGVITDGIVPIRRQMQRVSGGERKVYTVDAVVAVLEVVRKQMLCLYGNRLKYMDIKPENIMYKLGVDSSSGVRIHLVDLDSMLPRIPSRDGKPPGYVATLPCLPEHADGTVHIGPGVADFSKCASWMLGALLVVMLEKHYPSLRPPGNYRSWYLCLSAGFYGLDFRSTVAVLTKQLRRILGRRHSRLLDLLHVDPKQRLPVTRRFV